MQSRRRSASKNGRDSMRRALLSFALISVLAIAFAATATGEMQKQLRSVGLCIGVCEYQRSESFVRLFPRWFSSKNECGVDEGFHREVFSLMAPQAYARLLRDSDELELLAERQRDGLLTVAEREFIVRHNFRVVSPEGVASVGGNGRQAEVPRLRRCPRNGFVFASSNSLRPASFCWEYAEWTLQPRRGFTSSSYADWQYERMVRELYSSWRSKSIIEEVMLRMEADLKSDNELFFAARDVVMSRPASQVPEDSVNRMIDLERIRLKCDSR